jgi:hypothetical protein
VAFLRPQLGEDLWLEIMKIVAAIEECNLGSAANGIGKPAGKGFQALVRQNASVDETARDNCRKFAGDRRQHRYLIDPIRHNAPTLDLCCRSVRHTVRKGVERVLGKGNFVTNLAL